MEPQLVTRAAALDGVVERLLVVDRYALDTEFHRERTYWPRLALVQVAWPAGDAGPPGWRSSTRSRSTSRPLAGCWPGPG